MSDTPMPLTVYGLDDEVLGYATWSSIWKAWKWEVKYPATVVRVEGQDFTHEVFKHAVPGDILTVRMPIFMMEEKKL